MSRREKELCKENKELRRQVVHASAELRRLRGLLNARPTPRTELPIKEYARWHNMVVLSDRKARGELMESITNRVLDEPIEYISDEVVEILDRISHWGAV